MGTLTFGKLLFVRAGIKLSFLSMSSFSNFCFALSVL